MLDGYVNTCISDVSYPVVFTENPALSSREQTSEADDDDNLPVLFDQESEVNNGYGSIVQVPSDRPSVNA